TAIYLMVVERDTFKDEGLAYDIIGGVVEVLGSEGGCSNDGKTGIGALDEVAFNQLHRPLPSPSPFPSPSPPPSLPARLQPLRSCAWRAAGHRAGHRTNRRWP